MSRLSAKEKSSVSNAGLTRRTAKRHPGRTIASDRGRPHKVSKSVRAPARPRGRGDDTFWMSVREGLEWHVRAVRACADPNSPYLVLSLANGQEIQIDLEERLDAWSNGASAPNE